MTRHKEVSRKILWEDLILTYADRNPLPCNKNLTKKYLTLSTNCAIMNTQRTRKSPKNQKGKSMKKSSMKSLVAYLNGQDVPEIAEIKAELEAELAKGEAKAQANRELYAGAHDAVMGVMSSAPKTLAEIYEACKDELPEGFSKGKVQYAITRLWADEVVKTEGKVNTYSVKE